MSSSVIRRSPQKPHDPRFQTRAHPRAIHPLGSFRLRPLIAAILAIWLSGAASPRVAAAATEPSVLITPAQPTQGHSLEEMQRWHRDYRQRIRAVQLSATALSQALGRSYPKLKRPCQLLGRALESDRLPAIFPVPDRATDHHLRVAFSELRRAVRACRAERPTELIYRFQLARGAFVNVELTLRRYRLRP